MPQSETLVLFPPEVPHDTLTITGDTVKGAVRRFFASRISEQHRIVQHPDGRRVRYSRPKILTTGLLPAATE